MSPEGLSVSLVQLTPLGSPEMVTSLDSPAVNEGTLGSRTRARVDAESPAVIESHEGETRQDVRMGHASPKYPALAERKSTAWSAEHGS